MTLLAAIAVLSATLSLAGQPDVEALGNGVTFGAYAQPVNGQSNIDAMRALEDSLGRKLPMVRAFSDWDDPMGADKPLHTWTRDGGRQLMVSVKPRRDSGGRIQWRDIANAEPGSGLWGDMARLADGAKRYGEPMIVTFHHEPEAGTNNSYGNSDEFKRAFRKFVEVFRTEGASNVHFAWVMTSWSFSLNEINPGDRRAADKWYPGDDVVDYLGSDPYNWNNCRGTSTEPWASLQQISDAFIRYGRQHPSKPLILAEWGSDVGSSGQKAAWLDDARNLFKSGEYKDRLAAVLYFHDDGAAEGVPDCDWWLDTSGATLDAARRFVNDDFFRVRVPLGNNNQLPPATTAPTTRAPTTQAPTTQAPQPPQTEPAGDTAQPDGATPRCMGRNATIVGTAGNDVLRGTSGADVIVGLGGNDRIQGLGGNDVICGGSGRDIIRGNGGADRISGGQGRDKLLGGAGRDAIWGGSGRDVIRGNTGRDSLYGGRGDDRIHGGRHADRILGQGGDDNLVGHNGDDRLNGGSGRDRVYGNAGNDTCAGRAGRDTISSTCETTRR